MSDPGNQNTPPPPPAPPLQEETTTLAAVTAKILSSIVPAVVTEVNQATELSTAVTTTNTSDHTYRKSTFVQTVAGEGIAGACVWAAIFITCHQIYQYLRYVHVHTR